MAKIYVASSWRNQYFPEVVKTLREYGHEVYDFRNPPHDHGAFMWKNVDPDFASWTVAEYKKAWNTLLPKGSSKLILMP